MKLLDVVRKTAHHVRLNCFTFLCHTCIMASRLVSVPLSFVLWLCFFAVITVLVLSLIDKHYIKWWFHTYSPPHDTAFEGKYHLTNDEGEHELELFHSGQVKITSTSKEGHVTKIGPAPVYWVNKLEGKIVSDDMSFEPPQLIKLQGEGKSKTIQYTLASDETAAVYLSS